MLRLTEYEEKMLNGEQGKTKQVALKQVIKYANALGAEELCEVSKATLYLGAHPYLEVIESKEYKEIFSKMLLCSEETVEIGPFDEGCYCQTCVAPCDQYTYESLGLSKAFFDKNNDYLSQINEAGVSIVGSCTPYFTGWIPIRGEHFVTTESSNVLMCNAVFGACGNSDGIEAAVWSALCGRTPKWGNHLLENRKGTHVFEIKCLAQSSMDWDVIGYTIGRMLPAHGKPVVKGEFKRPDIIKLKQFFASLATTSGAEMCHIVGITPEANTLEEALGGSQAKGYYEVTQANYEESMRLLCDKGNGEVDFITLGCPHYSLEELKQVNDYIKGKQIKEGVKLFIWTDYSTKEMANVNGYTVNIEKAGGYLLTSACPLVIGAKCHKGSSGMAMDGAKQAHYIRSETNAKVYYGTWKQCIDAAVSGMWR